MSQSLLKKALFTSILASACFSSAAVAKTELIVSTWTSPNHVVNTTFWPTFKERVEKATDGRVTMKFVYDLATPQAQMDTIADGVADMGWIFHGYNGSRFGSQVLPEIPYFKNNSSTTISKAYWHVFDKYLSKANEHRGVKVLAVGVHGPGALFLDKEVKSLDDLKNKRVRVGGGVMSSMSKLLQVAGVAMPPTGVYEAASTGVIAGSFLTLEGLKSFRLAEVFPVTYTIPGGFYNGSFSIAINPDRWDSLPEEDRKALEGVIGEPLSELFGEVWGQADQVGIAFAKERGTKFQEASPEQLAKIKELSAHMASDWVAANKNKGYDAQAALEFFQTEIDAK